MCHILVESSTFVQFYSVQIVRTTQELGSYMYRVSTIASVLSEAVSRQGKGLKCDVVHAIHILACMGRTVKTAAQPIAYALVAQQPPCGLWSL